MFHNVSKVVLCDRRNTFASFSEDDSHFALWRPPSSFCVAGAALQTRRVTCSFGNLNVRAASSGDNVQIPWQVWHFVTCNEY